MGFSGNKLLTMGGVMPRRKKQEAPQYWLLRGTSFHVDTPVEVAQILQDAIDAGNYRLRLFYGDAKTGRDWCESYDVTGYIMRSTGPIKVPLLIHRSDTVGGPAIPDNCIVKIVKLLMRDLRYKKAVVYEHPKYHLPGEIFSGIDFTRNERRHQHFVGYIKPDKSLEVLARFKDEGMAEGWRRFIIGETMRISRDRS